MKQNLNSKTEYKTLFSFVFQLQKESFFTSIYFLPILKLAHILSSGKTKTKTTTTIH